MTDHKNWLPNERALLKVTAKVAETAYVPCTVVGKTYGGLLVKRSDTGRVWHVDGMNVCGPYGESYLVWNLRNLAHFTLEEAIKEVQK